MMERYSFRNDYSDGGHPRLLAALQQDPLYQTEGYGKDRYCIAAADLIRGEIESPDATIHFVSGGTQANLITLAAMLQPYESVIAADTSHIHVHETGSIEATGHKINLITTTDGKLTPGLIREITDSHLDEHQVRPRVVFISQSTELGTLYSKKELQDISVFCQENNLWLYLDGARMAAALTASTNDLTLPQISELVDVFYIGGTKNGALAGEAIVILRPEINQNFRYLLKQKGGLLAKGRFFGMQFQELFRDGLYYELGRHANHAATRLVKGIRKAGYNFLAPPVTNQLFPILPDVLIHRLERHFEFYVWEKADDQFSVIRLVTSWATSQEAVDEFLKRLMEDTPQ